MRILIGLAAGLSLAAALSAPAAAQDWCGFHQKAHSIVRCGYSSLQECKQALSGKKDGDKAVICLPDPSFG